MPRWLILTLTEQVHACLRWLILNYLAVLKIAKKHDKHCATNLQNAMAKVLLMQPFVVAMRASPLFHSDGEAVPAPSHPPPVARPPRRRKASVCCCCWLAAIALHGRWAA